MVLQTNGIAISLMQFKLLEGSRVSQNMLGPSLPSSTWSSMVIWLRLTTMRGRTVVRVRVPFTVRARVEKA